MAPGSGSARAAGLCSQKLGLAAGHNKASALDSGPGMVDRKSWRWYPAVGFAAEEYTAGRRCWHCFLVAAAAAELGMVGMP